MLQNKDPEHAPDIVISADTIVLLPSDTPASSARILEKPGSKAANLDMLEDQNGKTVKVITGVNVIYPSVQTPGYAIKYVLMFVLAWSWMVEKVTNEHCQ